MKPLGDSVSIELTQAELGAGLANLGARPTCHLMVHASLSAFGRIVGGAATVVTALREAAGKDGAVIVPSFRDAIRSEDYAMRECRAVCPQALCPSREPGHTGVVGETVRQQPDALRSCHPTHSWVGVGGDARFLLEGHCQSPTPCGRESPFFRLIERDGLVLLLGVGVNSMTNIHAVEDARNVPYLSSIDPPRRHATYTTSGRRIQYLNPDLLHSALAVCGLIRTTQIGAAACHAISARQLGAFLWLVTDDDPWCLVLRPRGNCYEPEVDAAIKTARMVEVWKNRPDCFAWKQLLRASGQRCKPEPFSISDSPRTDCPAYRGMVRGYHRCAANDLPPWEKFEDYPPDEPGVVTCGACNWPRVVRDAFVSAASSIGDRSTVTDSLRVGIAGFDITPRFHPRYGAWGTTPSMTEVDLPLLSRCIALECDDTRLLWFGSDLVGSWRWRYGQFAQRDCRGTGHAARPNPLVHQPNA